MNLYRLAAAFCATALILFSCSREEDVSREEAPSKEKEWKEVIITASLDEATQPDTRTSLVTEGGAIKEVLWSPGDSVKLFSLGEDAAFVSINTTPTRVARFKGMIPFITGADENGEVSYIYGLYPYRADATYSETEPGVSSTAVITTTLPNVQTGKAGTFDDGYAVTLGRSESLSVPFRTVYTLLRFSLTRDDITSVSFKGNNGEAIAGRFKVGMESKTSTIPEVKGFVSPETEITMKMADGSAFEGGQFYYFVMLPTTFSDGFTLSLTRSDGRSGDFVIDGKSLTLSRNKFSSISDLDTRVDNWTIVYETPEMVDLGLSVKWASFNLGATSPEEYGYYYAWGETEPKSDYSWATYKFCNGTMTSIFKYNLTDNLSVLEPEDDAATVNLGGLWRMPTSDELDELLDADNCDWEWTTYNGIYGHLVTSKINGNSIFLPDGGEYLNTSIQLCDPDDVYNQGGTFMSSSLRLTGVDVPYVEWLIGPHTLPYRQKDSYYRYVGYSVRPVYGHRVISVSSVSLDKTTMTLQAGGTSTLVATVFPDNATDKSVTWSSSNNSVATVDANGKVTAKAVGTATITVTTTDGGKTASCSVTVSPIAVTGVTLNKTTLSFTIGASETLTATIAPTTATNKNVTWSSSNTAVATVDANGKVSAVSAGSATITVTTVDGSKKATCTVTVNPISGGREGYGEADENGWED